MAPKLSEEEIDDLIYCARAGEDAELTETVAALAEREKVTPAEVIIAAKDESRKSTTLHMAAGNGHLETVRKLLGYFAERPSDEKQAFLDEPNEHGNTGLHWAALGGHLSVVKLLMEQGASPALANEQNYVPLDLANFNDKKDVAQHFLASAGMLEEENQAEGLAAQTAGVEIEDDGKDEQDGGVDSKQEATKAEEKAS
ncbi:ankyrin repeat-containing protein YAR1 [Emericellopsis atlantica]|uniref:Ankyrin repeat-containing protein YAR1 n=1 Tax=Emericellopsis atlantica TaxID=2614577 RepID=A0A9P8CMB2_9HYPO|nr:ankyrin repeat-containing protein YAR1 [Emericellopsis atlantica]KAG9252253.1 ankyrin repeat-containing protein YAR1 [Emericellopsis atlantica]